MKKRSKKYRAAAESFNRAETHTLTDAIRILKGFPSAKFEESVDLNVQLGIRPDQSSESVRGTVALPHGTGRKVRVLCFAKGEAEREAKQAGADFIGGEDYVKKVLEGWLEFDAVVAHPDMMREISKLGKVLGPRGLMPTPKTGTVTATGGAAIKEIKSGRVEFKNDKTGGLHVNIGKRSFAEEQLLTNAKTVIRAVLDAKPAAAKGDYLKRVTVSATQGPGIRLRSTPMGVVES
ncbi:MAG: 50S ribosomal protein L1 [Omnitrophica bacterium RIFCSPHIGHO2_02_FULL_49_9]|nr:MAG: 50S ribosomal protein L1 [Omnitrophica bacterium RIFCSPHIGHO2_02_FULL_49_9]